MYSDKLLKAEVFRSLNELFAWSILADQLKSTSMTTAYLLPLLPQIILLGERFL